MMYLPLKIPIPVKTDESRAGRFLIERELLKGFDVVVLDFAHSAVLTPMSIQIPSVMFTHNIEAEIFRRHVQVAKNFIKRAIWHNQFRKMLAYERETLRRFDAVAAVSSRDKRYFEDNYGAQNVSVIRTGVDTDFFTHSPPAVSEKVVFTGAMDWLANIDGIQYMIDEIWPQVVAQLPGASLTVVGRDPPRSLVRKARALGQRVQFTDFVDDVRPYVRSASVFVIPLRVGGGTRIKVFEAMALGCPVVSTPIGVEGLPVVDGKHYLQAGSATSFASAIVRLLQDRDLRERLSRQARRYVEDNFSSAAAAQDFEQICWRTIEQASRKTKLN
jgi:glycosyltransferase involved in cell wall biosynthesis